MRISDWSSDVCSSDLAGRIGVIIGVEITGPDPVLVPHLQIALIEPAVRGERLGIVGGGIEFGPDRNHHVAVQSVDLIDHRRSEEHTSELQSLMRISYAVLCLKNKKI